MFALFALLFTAALPDTTFDVLAYPVETRAVTVGAHAVAVYDEGGAGEAVVFLHGLGSHLGFWRATLPAFTDDFRVIALDFPGYGKSSKADVSGTMAFFAETVVGVLDALGVSRAHLVGHSMGGQVALTLALAHPDRVGRLVLAAPAGIETFTPVQAAAIRGMVTAERICAADAAQVQQQSAANVVQWDAARYGWLVRERLAVRSAPDFPAYCAANAQSIAGMLDGPVFDRLGEVAAPALVLFGADDALIPNRFLNPGTPAAIAERAGAALPHARVVVLAQAGHLLMLERPAAFNLLALDFLRRGK